MSEEKRLEETVLAQAMENQLAEQLHAADNIEVRIETDLFKVVQGKADSVSLSGKGLVVQPDVRVESLELQIDRISINPLSVIFGQVKLDQPLDTLARIVLTEADLNQTLNSDYVRHQLVGITLNVEGKDLSVEVQQPMSIDLQTPGKIGFDGTLLLHESTGDRQVNFHTVLCPRYHEQTLILEEFRCLPDQGISLEFAIALLHKIRELVQLPALEVAGMALRVIEMAIESGTLILQAEAHVYQLPQT